MKISLSDESLRATSERLAQSNQQFVACYPGESGRRQPVHTVYGGAHLFRADSAPRLGQVAQRSLNENAPDFAVFARAVGLPLSDQLPDVLEYATGLKQRLENDPEAVRGDNKAAWLAHTIYARVQEKLQREPVEDFRIDFEDGYGNRPDAEEDGHAEAAAIEVAKGMEAGSLPPFIGIRIKPFTEDLKYRGVRTLDIFLTALLEKTKGKLPANFVVMLPKVTIPEQVTTLIRFFQIIEEKNKLEAGTLKMETMVEATQVIMDDEGRNPLMRIIRASEGRCIAAHFGTYDYTASCGITAKYQTMAHPVCDFAHHMTKVALGGTGIFLSDGATNVMPVPPNRGEKLSKEKLKENMDSVHNAWRIGYGHTMHSLINGFYQGWDLNPAQLPMRYAATYSFFLSSYEEAVYRLKTFVERAAVSTLTGDIFDDAATGQGLLNFFLKAMNCGAISEEEAIVTGLSLDEIRSRSFYKILQGRRKKKS